MIRNEKCIKRRLLFFCFRTSVLGIRLLLVAEVDTFSDDFTSRLIHYYMQCFRHLYQNTEDFITLPGT